MKIGLLHYSAPPVVGGVEGVIGHHARLLADAGHAVTVIAGRGQPFDNRVEVCILPLLSSRNPDILELKHHLDRGDCPAEFDWLQAQLETQLLEGLRGFSLLLAHNIASLNKNLPLTAALDRVYTSAGFPRLVLWYHDLAWTTPRYRHELHDGHPWDLLRTPWEGATHVAVSELRRSELTRLWGASTPPIRVIPNGVDLTAFLKLEPETVAIIAQLQLMDADPLLLLPARLTPRKNIELALHVMAELGHEFPAATLVVTGPEGPHNPGNAAYKQILLSLRDELNLRGRVHFLAENNDSFLPHSVISDLFRLSDALFFPSREEGFGIPLIEAAVSRMPAFCADIPALRELGGQDVSYFDPGAPAADVAHLIALRLRGDSASAWSRRSRKQYAWEQIYRNHIDPLVKEVAE